MAEPSTLRGVLGFFVDIGIYDVVLPFLLVFTIVFAIFDKTKVLGVDIIDGEKYPKKNLNAIVAFTIAFFVIASAQLVEVITTVSSHVVILLLSSVFFLMMIGSVMKETEDGVFIEKGQEAFIIAMLVGIILIFLNALKWLDKIYEFLKNNWSNEWVASIILMLVIAGFIAWVTKSPTKKSKIISEDD